MYKTIPVIIVAAMSRQRRVIGRGNCLLWDLPADLQRFRSETLGKPVVMGRKTFESILAIAGKPLPKRPNIVVTRNADYAPTFENVTVEHSLLEGLEAASQHAPNEIHIGGGAELYTEALPYVDELRLTLIDDEPAGDAFFPAFADQFAESWRSELQHENGLTYEWVNFVRKP